jgi:hypothetical protein
MAIFAVDAASVAMNPNPSPTIPPMTTDMTSWNKQQSQHEISVGRHCNPPTKTAYGLPTLRVRGGVRPEQDVCSRTLLRKKLGNFGARRGKDGAWT